MYYYNALSGQITKKRKTAKTWATAATCGAVLKGRDLKTFDMLACWREHMRTRLYIESVKKLCGVVIKVPRNCEEWRKGREAVRARIAAEFLECGENE